jgi:hypothetical protein
MHGSGRRGRRGELLVSHVDDSFRFGSRRRRGGLDRRALFHGLIAFVTVLLGYAVLRAV